MFYLAAVDWGDIWPWVVGLLILVFVIFLIFVSKFINLWIQATLTKADISLFALIGMSLRKVSPTVIARVREIFPEIGDDPDPKTVFVKLRLLRNDW